MSSVSHYFIIASYAVVAAVVAMVLPQSVGGVDPVMGYVIGVCVFLVAALMHEIMSRRQEMHELTREVKDSWQDQAENAQQLHRYYREMSEDVGDLREVVAIQGTTASDAVIAEMKVLQSQLAQLASAAPVAVGMAHTLPVTRRVAPATDVLDDSEILQIVRAALEENRVDLYLQPIVSLPQRRPRYYEAFSRIRTDDGIVIAPEQYLGVAQARGLISTIDNLLLFRCVQLLRRLERKNRKAGFFVNLSVETLRDSGFFPQFLEFLESNRNLAGRIVFELSQAGAAFDVPEVAAHIDQLAELGYRFSIDNIAHLDLDFDRLARQHVRYIKVPADLLLSHGHDAGAAVHPADLKRALLRSKIDLIANKVETEPIVLELLDYGVDFGQGYLFGVPRPAREED